MLIDNITVYFIRGLFYFTERRPPTMYPMSPFDEQQRLQRPPPQPQRPQIHHQPQPRQPMRFQQLLSEPVRQGGMRTPSSSQSGSTSQSRTVSSFPGELCSEGQSEIKPSHQRGSMGEHPVIETQGAVPERKKAQRSPAVKREPETQAADGGSTSASTGTTSSRKKPSSKVTVACDFCRGG